MKEKNMWNTGGFSSRYLRSSSGFDEVRVGKSLVVCVVFYRPLHVFSTFNL